MGMMPPSLLIMLLKVLEKSTIPCERTFNALHSYWPTQSSPTPLPTHATQP